MERYFVVLKMKPNDKTGELPSDVDLKEVFKLRKAETYTIEECKKCVLNFIYEYGLTKEQWNGGRVYDTNKNCKYVGIVDYDGVFWSSDTEQGMLPKMDWLIAEANAIKEADRKRKENPKMRL